MVQGAWSPAGKSPKLRPDAHLVTSRRNGPLTDSPPPRATERRNPRSHDIDTLDVPSLVARFAAEDALVPAAVAAAGPEVARVVTLVEDAFRGGGRLFYVGAGTSGRLGVLDASECPPTFGTDPELVQGIIAGGEAALTRSIEGAEDDPVAARDVLVGRGVRRGDVVVGIAASGSTPFVRGALEQARAVGAHTALVTCAVPPDATAALADVVVRLDVGPELVTGSTRLKAGTATKLVLNTITTGALIRIGKTYGNLMVDLQARNAKLRERGERIVVEVLGVTRDAARAAIAAADGRVRTAIAMLALDVTREEAERRLDAVDRHLRPLLGPPPEVKS
jgi:N-acetylmuramic acid 6-phosphate etherase